MALTVNPEDDPPVVETSFRRNSYVLKLIAPRPELVYVSDSFRSGWSATVNGRPASVLTANYAFKAVELPVGPVQVRFAYWPPGLASGLWIAGTSLLVALGQLDPSTLTSRSGRPWNRVRITPSRFVGRSSASDACPRS